jgi:molybdate transport system ATP-binding protein
MTAPTPRALDARISVRVGEGDQTFHVQAELLLESGVLVLFGPSGAGKSLTLRALTGLSDVTSGHVRVGEVTLLDADKRVNVPVHERRIGYVPQEPSLFPFASVEANVGFALSKDKRRGGEVKAMMERLGIDKLARARPGSLSGGERQRVALARALVTAPRLLVLDEPFSSLDDDARASLQRVVEEVARDQRVPVVLVTHSRDEARALGSRFVRFERVGREARGTPADL